MFHIILNPMSSSGNGRKVFEKIEPILKERNIEYKLYETIDADSAKKFAGEITCDDSNDILIGIGGDGTMNEILNGIKDLSKVTMGYIPSGSGGDLAKGLNIPKDPIAALNIILNPKEYKMMDVCHMDNKECSKNFSVSCSIGLDAAITHAANVSPLKVTLNKYHLGKLIYLVTALQKLKAAEKASCTVILDDVRKISFDHFFFVTTMNQKYEGGGFMFCPKATCDDGYIDVCVAGNISKPNVLKLMPLAMKGKHTGDKGINIYKAKKIQVIADKPLAIHTDGEYAGIQNEMTVTLCDKKIRMIVR